MSPERVFFAFLSLAVARIAAAPTVDPGTCGLLKNTAIEKFKLSMLTPLFGELLTTESNGDKYVVSVCSPIPQIFYDPRKLAGAVKITADGYSIELGRIDLSNIVVNENDIVLTYDGGDVDKNPNDGCKGLRWNTYVTFTCDPYTNKDILTLKDEDAEQPEICQVWFEVKTQKICDRQPYISLKSLENDLSNKKREIHEKEESGKNGIYFNKVIYKDKPLNIENIQLGLHNIFPKLEINEIKSNKTDFKNISPEHKPSIFVTPNFFNKQEPTSSREIENKHFSPKMHLFNYENINVLEKNEKLNEEIKHEISVPAKHIDHLFINKSPLDYKSKTNLQDTKLENDQLRNIIETEKSMSIENISNKATQFMSKDNMFKKNVSWEKENKEDSSSKNNESSNNKNEGPRYGNKMYVQQEDYSNKDLPEEKSTNNKHDNFEMNKNDDSTQLLPNNMSSKNIVTSDKTNVKDNLNQKIISPKDVSTNSEKENKIKISSEVMFPKIHPNSQYENKIYVHKENYSNKNLSEENSSVNKHDDFETNKNDNSTQLIPKNMSSKNKELSDKTNVSDSSNQKDKSSEYVNTNFEEQNKTKIIPEETSPRNESQINTSNQNTPEGQLFNEEHNLLNKSLEIKPSNNENNSSTAIHLTNEETETSRSNYEKSNINELNNSDKNMTSSDNDNELKQNSTQSLDIENEQLKTFNSTINGIKPNINLNSTSSQKNNSEESLSKNNIDNTYSINKQIKSDDNTSTKDNSTTVENKIEPSQENVTKSYNNNDNSTVNGKIITTGVTVKPSNNSQPNTTFSSYPNNSSEVNNTQFIKTETNNIVNENQINSVTENTASAKINNTQQVKTPIDESVTNKIADENQINNVTEITESTKVNNTQYIKTPIDESETNKITDENQMNSVTENAESTKSSEPNSNQNSLDSNNVLNTSDKSSNTTDNIQLESGFSFSSLYSKLFPNGIQLSAATIFGGLGSLSVVSLLVGAAVNRFYHKKTGTDQIPFKGFFTTIIMHIKLFISKICCCCNFGDLQASDTLNEKTPLRNPTNVEEPTVKKERRKRNVDGGSYNGSKNSDTDNNGGGKKKDGYGSMSDEERPSIFGSKDVEQKSSSRDKNLIDSGEAEIVTKTDINLKSEPENDKGERKLSTLFRSKVIPAVKNIFERTGKNIDTIVEKEKKEITEFADKNIKPHLNESQKEKLANIEQDVGKAIEKVEQVMSGANASSNENISASSGSKDVEKNIISGDKDIIDSGEAEIAINTEDDLKNEPTKGGGEKNLRKLLKSKVVPAVKNIFEKTGKKADTVVEKEKKETTKFAEKNISSNLNGSHNEKSADIERDVEKVVEEVEQAMSTASPNENKSADAGGAEGEKSADGALRNSENKISEKDAEDEARQEPNSLFAFVNPSAVVSKTDEAKRKFFAADGNGSADERDADSDENDSLTEYVEEIVYVDAEDGEQDGEEIVEEIVETTTRGSPDSPSGGVVVTKTTRKVSSSAHPGVVSTTEETKVSSSGHPDVVSTTGEIKALEPDDGGKTRKRSFGLKLGIGKSGVNVSVGEKKIGVGLSGVKFGKKPDEPDAVSVGLDGTGLKFQGPASPPKKASKKTNFNPFKRSTSQPSDDGEIADDYPEALPRSAATVPRKTSLGSAGLLIFGKSRSKSTGFLETDDSDNAATDVGVLSNFIDQERSASSLSLDRSASVQSLTDNGDGAQPAPEPGDLEVQKTGAADQPKSTKKAKKKSDGEKKSKK